MNCYLCGRSTPDNSTVQKILLRSADPNAHLLARVRSVHFIVDVHSIIDVFMRQKNENGLWTCKGSQSTIILKHI